MKRFLAFLVLACAPMALAAGDPTQVAFKWDLASTSYTFPRFCTFPITASVSSCPGAGTTPGDGNGVSKFATTAGVATTTVTSVNTNSPFAGMGVGDLIVFTLPPIIQSTGAVGGNQMRVVTTFTSANSIVVDSNITIDNPGVSFRWWKLTTGTGAEDGYLAFPVPGIGKGNLTAVLDVATLNATSLDYKLECRTCLFDRCLTPVIMAGPTNIVAAGVARVSIVDEQYSQCRVGMKLNTDTGVQSISVTFGGEVRP